MNIVLTDDDGYYPIGVFPARAGGAKFQAHPQAVVQTDADGYDGSGKGLGGVFVAAPIAAKSITATGTDGIVSGAKPCVKTDRRGYSIWSGRFVGAPIPMVIS